MIRKKFTHFRPRIKSRHPSHKVLRGQLPLFPFKSVIRFGSSTEVEDTVENGGRRVELNSTHAIKNSSNKRLMKECFKKHNVRTAVWYTFKNGNLYDEINNKTLTFEQLEFPIIAKRHFGSRGQGNTKIDTLQAFKEFIAKTTGLNGFIFEKFYNFAREYRLHVTKNGYFYSCRKMMKRDTPDENKWYKNDNNCIWALEANADFDKPINWKEVEKECVKALVSVGLDFGAIDLRIQASNDDTGNKRTHPAFIVVEINSAPSFGNITEVKYKEMLPELLRQKAKEQ